MAEPMTMGLSAQFEMERMVRVIDGCNDVRELRGLCRQLLQAWHTQRAATVWVMGQKRPGTDLDPAAALPAHLAPLPEA